MSSRPALATVSELISKKEKAQLAVVVHTFSPNTLEASLVYRVSARTARAVTEKKKRGKKAQIKPGQTKSKTQ